MPTAPRAMPMAAMPAANAGASPVDMSMIPPQIQQQLAAQAGARGPQDIQAILVQLAQDPQALAQALQQFGINVTPEQLQAVAEDWVDQAASRAAGETPEGDEDVADATDADGEGDGDVAPSSGAGVPSGAAGMGDGMTPEDMVSMAMEAEDMPVQAPPQRRPTNSKQQNNGRPPARKRSGD